MGTFNFTNASDTSLTGTNGDDTFNFNGSGSNDSAIGQDGNDVFNGSSAYSYVTVSGGLGSDYFSGFGSSSLIYGNQGNDYFELNGSGTKSTLYGGQGNDYFYGTSGSSYLIYGNRGDDFINLSGGTVGGSNTVYGGIGSDTIIGSAGSDSLVGGQGDDLIESFGEKSIVFGDDIAGLVSGDDTIFMIGGQSTGFGGQGADIIETGGNANLVYGNQGSDVLFDGVGGGVAENNTLYGGQGSDLIATASGLSGGGTSTTTDDVIYGNLGNDQIFTGADRATVYGGQGNDTIAAVNTTGGAAPSDQSVLVGGQGVDTFFLNGQFVGQGEAGAGSSPQAITIADFVTGTDRISFGGPDGNTDNFASASVNGGLFAAEQIAEASGTTYTFVAGTKNGYLFYNDGMNDGLQGTTLTGLNNTSAVKFTDIFGGTAPTAPTPTAFPTPGMNAGNGGQEADLAGTG